MTDDTNEALEALKALRDKADDRHRYEIVRRALEQRRVPALTEKERAIIAVARNMANRNLPNGDVGMTEELAPWAYCLHLIAIIERHSAAPDNGGDDEF